MSDFHIFLSWKDISELLVTLPLSVYIHRELLVTLPLSVYIHQT